ncbi:phage/plasmid primase, P4 family [Breoghania sp. L-A4]|uniref:DNA primase family protein n=1 Tax=Breoghania sp. L-A4 TaxID=2304600 RepID=UPI000E35C065|nr:phage/plasmid primase, P4 family [Breoghania sp. L-A4]AXS39788.1 hypothetical protein D1F64_06635 [Breoghania sp. L-A4]
MSDDHEAYGAIVSRIDAAEAYDFGPTDGGDDTAPPSPPASESHEGGSGPVNEAILGLCAAEPETDIGNGRRFLHWNRDGVLYVARIGWHVYDGMRWAEDVEGRLIRPLAHQVVERIVLEARLIDAAPFEAKAIEAAKEAADALTRSEDKAADAGLKRIVAEGADAEKALKGRKSGRRRYGKTSGSSGKLDNMLREGAPYVSWTVSDLDADPLAINCQNGTIRLVQGLHPTVPDAWGVQASEHNRRDLISKLMPVDHSPGASAPLFHEFLERVQPNQTIRKFLQRYFGYCLTALTTEQVFAFFYGEGRNGKSTLVDLVSRILGDYSTTVPFETLAGDERRKGGEATPDLARLPGARMVRASEPEQGMKLRESVVKALTGGEPILIRRLHAEFNEVYPTFKLVISGNHKPDVRGTDDGIWRRVLLVPWEIQIPREDVDQGLPDKLWAERAGVLNWMIEGALDYLTYGLEVPDEVRAATDSYREESDPVGAFIAAACDITGDPNDVMTPGALYTAYKIFCDQAAFNHWTASTFNRQLPRKASKLGFAKAKTNGNTVYRGIRLRSDFGSAPIPSYTPDGRE